MPQHVSRSVSIGIDTTIRRHRTHAQAGCEVVDLHAIKFNPVFGRDDYSFFAHESVPAELWNEAELKEQMVALSGGPVRTACCWAVATRQGSP